MSLTETWISDLFSKQEAACSNNKEEQNPARDDKGYQRKDKQKWRTEPPWNSG